jgi:hypothetical protein
MVDSIELKLDTVYHTEIKINNWREPQEPPMSTNILVTILFALGAVVVMITRKTH